MTTNYTSTVDITTPAVTLTDFTAVVPASLGVNVYSGATSADINDFDIGPTGDSNILLQTLAVGGHHVHGGVCHDSAHGTVPPYGVHGIYDKANGTLVEQMEFYSHPNGQGYSPRYANRLYQSLFHDTPFSIGLFNYQGAALGAGGVLRIRECIFYNVPSGGYVFYSDGLWLESDGSLLGNSLISVEIDHCTIDVRGVTEPFDFSQCHNDVYLTNSVIISDSGLPLSSIITPPTGGATVHLDGSIVLDSADAATYLGPAPAFTPIAVGGSPVIGTAAASPPGVYAQWGNAGDLGATQTGSTPPGPPPLPPPASPTLVSLGVVAQAAADGSDTISLDMAVSVPRSDPSLGASIIVVYVVQIDAQVTDVSDDAPTDPFYSTHLYTDGQNPWEAKPTVDTEQVWQGLALNPLNVGEAAITVQLNQPSLLNYAFAVAYTGAQVNNQSDPTYQVPDLPFSTWFEGIAIPGPFGEAGDDPVGPPTALAYLWQWEYPSESITLLVPSPLGYPAWSIITGQIALIFIQSGVFSTTDPGTFTPDDGTWDEIGSLINTPESETIAPSLSLVIFEKPLAVPELDDDLDGSWSTASTKGTGLGFGFPIIAGLGPIWLVTPPPSSGIPIFNNHIRLSE